MRPASLKRKTKATDIEVAINLDGTGVADVSTGIGFFDHMLDLLARHSRIDITVKAVGDLHVDHHHTTEDVGIALGQALKQALGNMAGITRYASIHMPMDETLSRVVIDISGRPVLVFQVEFPRDKVGQFDTELVREWFNAFTINAGVTLHVETLYGENSHHIAESCFKGLARALRAAVAIDPRAAGEVPSTKGQLGGCSLRSHRSMRMPVFTVHGPAAGGMDIRRSDKFVFVRDGFHFWAVVFGPIWLIWNRLWLATIGWIIVSTALHLGLVSLGAGRLTIWLADFMVAILMGFEAASLQRWTFSRGKWRQLDLVVADDEESAERRFFARWADTKRAGSYDPLTVDRGGPPPTRIIPGQPFSKPPPPLPQGGIIGLFPEPGAQR
jgi:imidazoleglycerol-phosphate dehydratase